MMIEVHEVRWRDEGHHIVRFRRRIAGGTSPDEAPRGEEPADAQRGSRHLIARRGTEIVASVRLHRCPDDAPIAAAELSRLPRGVERLAISAFIVDPAVRHTPTVIDLFRAAYRRARALGAHIMVTGVSPHLVMMYEALGFFRYGPGFRSEGQPFRVPLLLDLHDVAYMRQMGSALSAVAARYQNQTNHSEAILEALSEITAETRPPRRAHLAPTLMTDGRRRDIEAAIFSGIEGEALQRAQAHTLNRAVDAGQTLVSAGDLDPTLFVLVEGVLAIVPRGQSQPVAYIQEGEVVGEAALVGSGATRAADITALSDCKVIALRPSDLEALMRADATTAARLWMNLAAAMAERLAHTTRLLIGEATPVDVEIQRAA